MTLFRITLFLFAVPEKHLPLRQVLSHAKCKSPTQHIDEFGESLYETVDSDCRLFGCFAWESNVGSKTSTILARYFLERKAVGLDLHCQTMVELVANFQIQRLVSDD
jgi:hypothetical protein